MPTGRIRNVVFRAKRSSCRMHEYDPKYSYIHLYTYTYLYT